MERPSTTKTILCLLLCTAIMQLSDGRQYATTEWSLQPPQQTERQLLLQFFNYMDSATSISLDNMLRMSHGFVEQLLAAIPKEQRGNTAALLQQYLLQTRFAQSSNSNELKASTLLGLNEIVATIRDEMVKQEPEDLILKRELVGIFRLLAHMSLEDQRFHKKVIRAVQVLDKRRAIITQSQQERRNEDDFGEIYSLLHAIVGETDVVRREFLIKKLHQLKARYLEN